MTQDPGSTEDTRTNPPQPQSAVETDLTVLHFLAQSGTETAFFENLPVRIFWKDTTSTLMGCNELFARDMGFTSPAGLVGKTDFDLAERELAEKYRRDDQTVIQTGKPLLRFQEEHSTIPKGKHTIQTSKFPLFNEQGHVIGVLGIYTEADPLSELQTQRDKLYTEFHNLSSEARVREEFIAHICHELLTPLTSMRINLHLLEHKPDEMKKYVGTLERELSRMENMVDDLRQLHSFGSKAFNLETSEVDLNLLALELVLDRHALAQSRDISITLKTPEQPLIVICDKPLIGEALSNLLVNAISYSLPGGVVTVESLNHPEKPEWAGIKVTDKGYGIPPKETVHLFNRLYRGHAAKVSDQPGSGLGLSIVNEIMVEHGGFVDVVSEGEDKGAAFTLWLMTNGPEILD